MENEQLPKGWEVKKLGEVCEIYQPKTISKKMMLVDGEYPVFGANGIIGKYDKYNHELSQLLVTCRGATCGSVNVSEPKSWINGNAMVIKPITEDLSFRFVEYFFRGSVNLSNIITGAAQPQITRQNLSPVEIPIPPLTQQKQIVKILDQAFTAIDKAKNNAQQNLLNAKQLFESYLQNVFENKGDDWVEDELINICNEITDGSHFSPKSSSEDIYPYITVRDINEDIINFNNCKFIDKENYQKLIHNGCKPNKGDLLFSKDGTVGKVSLVDFEKDFVVLSSLAIIRPKTDVIISSLLKYILKNPLFLKTAIGMKTGVAIRRIILRNLKKIKISHPKSKEEQQKIVKKLNALQAETKKLESIYEQKIADLEELKKSILQKAFSGALT